MDTEILDTNVWIKEKQIIHSNPTDELPSKDKYEGCNHFLMDQNLERFFNQNQVSDADAESSQIDQKELIYKIVEKQYLRGQYLGQGGYAKCFQVSSVDPKSKQKTNYACKIIEKKKLFCHEGDDEKTRQNIERRKKIVEKELQLHKGLNH